VTSGMVSVPLTTADTIIKMMVTIIPTLNFERIFSSSVVVPYQKNISVVHSCQQASYC